MAALGFIGLGRMGLHMARNLLRAGHDLTVYNRSQDPVRTLTGEGARPAAAIGDVARNARVLFLCLPGPATVDAVVAELLEASEPGQIIVDHSTIGMADARRAAEVCAARGVRFIDAPVSGGPWGAEAGTLTIMCGGDPEAYKEVVPFLQAEGKQLYHLGPAGAGTVAKLCNQLLVGIHTAAMAEAFVAGTKAGLDPKVLHEIIAGATGHSKQIERHIPKFVLPGNFEAAFSIEHLHKDVALAVSLGKDLQVRMLLGGLTQQVLEEARAAGYAGADIAAVIRPLEELSGVKVRG